MWAITIALGTASISGCTPIELAYHGASALGLDPISMNNKAEARETIRSCEADPDGYATRDGVKTATPCSRVLAVYHQQVMAYCNEHPSRSAEINGTKKKCSQVFEQHRKDVSYQCNKTKQGYVTVNGIAEACGTALR